MSNSNKILIVVAAFMVAAGSTYYVTKISQKNPSKDGVTTENQLVEAESVDKNLTKFVIEIRENKFVPEVLEVPAGKDFQLVVRNMDKTIEEFESTDLKKEKLVKGGKEIVLNISALQPGEYKFFGEFHPRTAQGKIVAK
jgi:plastocyanin